MRWVMTRVLPLPAPARISTGAVGGQHRLALLGVEPRSSGWDVGVGRLLAHSTVTDLARLRGWSTSRPARTAMWYARSCRGAP